LVFSTLHTNDAPSSFVRLIDIGIKPFLVASGVRAVLAQRLVRTNCNTCKAPYTPEEIEIRRLAFPVDVENIEFLHGTGCDSCNDTGYTGRLGVYELLKTSDDMRTMIMTGSSSAEMRYQARVEGMTTLRADAWKKVLNGITTVEEVNKKTKADPPLDTMKSGAA
jgi:type II secretory ATPase GspE/PulE/Tfp pilus assembly ATPase PilB-like protein